MTRFWAWLRQRSVVVCAAVAPFLFSRLPRFKDTLFPQAHLSLATGSQLLGALFIMGLLWKLAGAMWRLPHH